MADYEDEITRAAIAATRGSVVAAAGCGKTERIAIATGLSEGRRLILTHTHAGVDALRSRLAKLEVPAAKFRIDTIAGWSLRYAAAFPKASGIAKFDPRSGDWSDVYQAASTLLESGAVRRILRSSYAGIFVDEYQDCEREQHQIINLLADDLPTCVFGDPLQAIFDFSGTPVDWPRDVQTAFPSVGELKTPHRWRRANNHDMADWLVEVRQRLMNGERFGDVTRPACVVITKADGGNGQRTAAILTASREAHKRAGDKRVVIIGDEAKMGSRQNLAKGLSKLGFSNIEPLDCKPLYAVAKKLDAASTGVGRLKHLAGFSGTCMTGLGPKMLQKAIESHLGGGHLGRARYGDAITAAVRVATQNTDQSSVEFLDKVRRLPNTHLYCRERFYALQRALERKAAGQATSLQNAVWDVQNQGRHVGRRIGARSVGSTLLVKGLEFERAVLAHSSTMSNADLYVAVTRATDGLEIVFE